MSVPPHDSRAGDTKDRILDVAEKLFTERGSEGTSLRAITTAAGVNVAAVHYHFGSKEALLRAVVQRRLGPVNQERLKRLDRLRARREEGPTDLEETLRALLEPVMDPARAPAHREVSALLYREPLEVLEPLLAEVFGEVSRQFRDAVAEALPHLAPEEVAERFHFAVGAMVHVLSGHFALGMAGAGFAPRPLRELSEALVRFLAAGLRAPAGDPCAPAKGRKR